MAVPAQAGWIDWGSHWGGGSSSSSSSGGTSSGGTTSSSSSGGTMVPEPSDLALFGFGVAGLVIGRRAARNRRNRRD
jgi:hypothetical protein